jgi:thioredoxin-like negative regulator of GroEL
MTSSIIAEIYPEYSELELGVGDSTRAECLFSAQNCNFSKDDLIDPCSTIAVLTAMEWARTSPAVASTKAKKTTDEVDAFILAGMRYRNDRPNAILEDAIKTLPDLVKHQGPDTLKRIGQLLVIFSYFTHTFPDQWRIEDWRVFLYATGQTLIDEVKEIYKDPTRDRARIDEVLNQVVAHYGSLWS